MTSGLTRNAFVLVVVPEIVPASAKTGPQNGTGRDRGCVNGMQRFFQPLRAGKSLNTLGFHDEFDWPFPGIVEPRKRSAATCHVRASRDVLRSKRPQLIPQQDSGTSAAVDVLVSGYASSLRFP